MALSSYEKGHKAIMNQLWLAYLLGLEPDATRSVLDRFKNARSLFTRRPPGAPVAPGFSSSQSRVIGASPPAALPKAPVVIAPAISAAGSQAEAATSATPSLFQPV